MMEGKRTLNSTVLNKTTFTQTNQAWDTSRERGNRLGHHLLSTELGKLDTLLEEIDKRSTAGDADREGKADDVEERSEESDGPANKEEDNEPKDERKDVHLWEVEKIQLT